MNELEQALYDLVTTKLSGFEQQLAALNAALQPLPARWAQLEQRVQRAEDQQARIDSALTSLMNRTAALEQLVQDERWNVAQQIAQISTSVEALIAADRNWSKRLKSCEDTLAKLHQDLSLLAADGSTVARVDALEGNLGSLSTSLISKLRELHQLCEKLPKGSKR
jgi:chromosome segregation ATPase